MSVQVVRFTYAGEEAEPVAPTIGEPGRPYTVVYDGHCKVCGRLVNLLTKWDKKHILEIAPSQAPGVQARFPWIPPRAYVESVQVIRNRDGKTWQAAELMDPTSLLSWVFWTIAWRPERDGPAGLQVRAYDKQGQPQVATRTDPLRNTDVPYSLFRVPVTTPSRNSCLLL